jgi:hypothetical protein
MLSNIFLTAKSHELLKLTPVFLGNKLNAMTQHSLINPEETYTAECHFCGNSFNTDDLTEVDGESVCRTCLHTERVKQCPVCLDEMIYHDQEMCFSCEQAEIEDKEAEKDEMNKDLKVSNLVLLSLFIIAVMGFIILKIIL